MFWTVCVALVILETFVAEVKSAATKRSLPDGALNMGYVSMCDSDKTIHAVETGLNVLFWFSIDLVNDNGSPAVVPSAVQPLPDLDCIAEIVSTLSQRNISTTHLVTVGGWGAPDPVTDFSAAEMWSAWKSWNEEVVAGAGIPGGFDGIDWDMEGANDPDSPSNYLSREMLDLVGSISQLAQQDGYIVSMVPPESYLDQTTALFDGSLLHPYPEWEQIVDFNYHGHNGYAYLLAKYGKTEVPFYVSSTPVTATAAATTTNTTDGVLLIVVDTFDLVSIQLYESYTHMAYNVTAAPTDSQQTAAEYLIEWIPRVLSGWVVDFSADAEYTDVPARTVSVKSSALCIGLANGWADNKKNILIMPEDAGAAYETLAGMGMAPRGFVFWAVENEGEVPPGQTEPLYMASGLNDFLHTR